MLCSGVSDHLTYTHDCIYRILLPTVLFPVFYILTVNSYQSLSHGIGRYPDLVVVQLKLNNGYVSEAGGEI